MKKMPDRQFFHHAAGTLALRVVCCSPVVVTVAGVNGEPVQLDNGGEGILDAFVEKRSDEGVNRREIGEAAFALQGLEVEIHRNFLASVVAMVLEKVASGN
jgi:hypothetical protein